MEYTIEQFKKDVLTEATNIRLYATEEELERLDKGILNPNSPAKCVYGMMTGSCISDRAIELIKKCCPIYFENTPGMLCRKSVDIKYVDEVFSRVGESADIDMRANGLIDRLSAIETYILTPGANNYELVDFLKKKTDVFKP